LSARFGEHVITSDDIVFADDDGVLSVPADCLNQVLDAASDLAGRTRAGARCGASFTPHPALVSWLDRQPGAAGECALVIGCGYGDDAEELARRGYRVMAFDVAPTAIARCRARFPSSAVEYLVADLFALPQEWQAAFALVVENRTLQSLPLENRPAAVRAIAGPVRTGGKLCMRCLGRDRDETIAERPWPVSVAELDGFRQDGLHEVELVEHALASGRGRTFTIVYQR
jgi:SAM-dependent methyltransferase